MRTRDALFLAATLGLATALPLAAQQAGTIVAHPAGQAPVGPDTTAQADTAATNPLSALVASSRIQHAVPRDQRGLNQFEPPKWDGKNFRGFAWNLGAAFTQSFQDLSHSNSAAPKIEGGTNVNAIKEIGAGFDNAGANLYLDAQLAPGIRVALESYLSSRHHTDAWVKDGYLLVDQSPIQWLPLHVSPAAVARNAPSARLCSSAAASLASSPPPARGPRWSNCTRRRSADRG